MFAYGTTYGDANSKVIITSAGNVGIRTVTPNANLNVSGTVNITGSMIISASSGLIIYGQSGLTGLDLSNSNILNANKLSFADPGPGEGLDWATGGGLWQIYECPDDGANSAGNLQFVSGSGAVRTMTLYTGSGNLWVRGHFTGSGVFVPSITASNVISSSNSIVSNNITASGTISASNMIISNIYLTNITASIVSASNKVITGQLTGSTGIFSSTFTAQQFVETSLLRYKENIAPIGSQLNNLQRLNPVSFDWKGQNNGTKNFGFIAEEVKEVYPEFVSGDGINYSKMVSILVKAVNELRDRVEEQDKIIKELRLKNGNT
jgi:hypothetical protein